VGFYERDSVVAACGEYLKALEMVETHFPGIETRHGTSLQPNHLPRFMALTYGRLGDLFSGQFMQEPAIVCYKKSFVFSKIEATSATGIARLLSSIGQQYDVLRQTDSAGYYYNETFKYLHDTNNLVYRDLISEIALYNYNSGKGVESAVSDLKRMVIQTTDENERLTRFFTIGSIYYGISQFDSALVYLTRVFENMDDVVLKRDAARCLRNIYQIKGDSLNAAQYARYQVENPVLEGESNRRVSQLNELFQQHLQWEQERAEAERQQAARQRRNRMIVVVMMALGLGLWWWLARRKKEHEAETQTWHKEKQQLQTQVDDALQQLQTVDDALQQLQTQADDALQQARAMLPQRVADLYRAKVPNRLERIMDEFEAAYPGTLERVAAAYPELSETERQIAVLNFLHFRAKEEADLLGLSDNTVNKYRSNLRKKTENASFSSFLD
jgi:tetratricopeptide (TPR) repeat protein